MYIGVPSTAPLRVSAGDDSTRCARPKSATFGCSPETRMLSGLRSRWMMPFSWAWWMPRATFLEQAQEPAAVQRLPLQDLRERLARDELHHQVGLAALAARVEDLHDPGVVEPRQRLRFAGEALADHGMAEEAVAEDLHRHDAAELRSRARWTTDMAPSPRTSSSS
jgi:hypothetical protein